MLLTHNNSERGISSRGTGNTPEEKILELLRMRFVDSNDPELHERRKELRKIFQQLESSRAAILHSRLKRLDPKDERSRLFYKLATATRTELLTILEEKIKIQRQITQRKSSKSTPQKSAVVSKPDGIVRLPSIEVFSKPTKILWNIQALLYYKTVISRIITKKKINGLWWYEIEYSYGGKSVKGWSLAEGVAELAWPGKFRFMSRGGSGFKNPFEELRNAVKGKPVEKKVARSINLMNVFLLPNKSSTLSDFVEEAFYHALVTAKGNFKEACLILTASFRAFKPAIKGGQFRWVQQVDAKSKNFNYTQYADKLWHFFWNAYKRLDGTSAWILDKLGMAYELKTRSSPVWSAFTLKGLSRDAKEDIAFNRGGIAFAEWINKNHSDVTKSHATAMKDIFVTEAKKFKKFRNLSEDEKARVIQKLMKKKASQNELKKRTYREFAKAAAGIVDNVVKAVKKMK